MSEPSLLARILAGGHTFGGRTYGGNTFGGGTYGGNTFGASATPPTPPVTVRATPPQLPAFVPPGSFSNAYMPPMGAPTPPQPPRPTPMMIAAAQPQPQPQAMPPMAPDTAGQGLPPMPPPQQIGPPAGAMPLGRNELEREYYRQLAANPNGFDKGLLGRLFG